MKIMPKIILINGACGVGKSTISKLLHKNLEFSFLFSRDEERRKISNYNKDEKSYKCSGDFINEILFSIIKTCIKNDKNLIIDAVFIDKKVILEIEKIVGNKGNFYHFYLNASRNVWEKRLLSRGFFGSLTLEKANNFYNSLTKLKSKLDLLEIETGGLSCFQVCLKIEKILHQKLIL